MENIVRCRKRDCWKGDGEGDARVCLLYVLSFVDCILLRPIVQSLHLFQKSEWETQLDTVAARETCSRVASRSLGWSTSPPISRCTRLETLLTSRVGIWASLVFSLFKHSLTSCSQESFVRMRCFPEGYAPQGLPWQDWTCLQRLQACRWCCCQQACWW